MPPAGAGQLLLLPLMTRHKLNMKNLTGYRLTSRPGTHFSLPRTPVQFLIEFFFCHLHYFFKSFLQSPLRWQGKCSHRVQKKRLFLNSPCLSALLARVADGEASFAAPGVLQRVAWPLPGDGGTDVGIVPGHTAGGAAPAHSSLALAQSTPKPCSRGCAAGTHHSRQVSGITTYVTLRTPMKSSSKAANTSWLPGFSLFPSPFAGNAKGLQSRYQTLFSS